MKYENTEQLIKESDEITQRYKPLTKAEYQVIYSKLRYLGILTDCSCAVFIISFIINCSAGIAFLVCLLFSGKLAYPISTILFYLFLSILISVVSYILFRNYNKLLLSKLYKEGLTHLERGRSFREVDFKIYGDLNFICERNEIFKRKIKEILEKRNGCIYVFDYMQLEMDKYLLLYDYIEDGYRKLNNKNNLLKFIKEST
ncbi:hypothetical protein R4575_18125 [Acinetobacter baumannii]|nr:hypothetical protein [Acinetobacter baumannii]